MALVTLRPNTTPQNDWAVTVPSGTQHGATSDNSDTTFAYDGQAGATINHMDRLKLGFQTTAIPANAIIKSVTPRIRVKTTASLTLNYYVRSVYTNATGGSTTYQSPTSSAGVHTAITPLTGTAGAAMTAKGAPAQSLVDNLEMWLDSTFQDFAGSSALYEAYIDVVYSTPPTVSAVSISGATTRPAVSWTYTDPEGDAQDRVWVKVFTQAQTLAGGFSPDTTTPVWDSGEKTGYPSTSLGVGADLLNGLTYIAYVKASDVGSAGANYSGWAASGAFTVVLDLPPSPQIALSTDNTNGRVQLIVSVQGNQLSTNQASLETDTTGWIADTNTTIARTTTQASLGAASLQLTSVAAGDVLAHTLSGTAGTPVVPGVTYTVAAVFRSAALPRTARVNVYWYNSAGGLLSSNAGGNITTTTTGWTQATYTGVAPAGAAFAAVQVQVFATAAANEIHYADQIGLWPGTSNAWNRGGLADIDTVFVERSQDSGVTWAPVPLLGAIPTPSTTAQATTVYDYAAPPNTLLLYRATTQANDGGNYLASAPLAALATATVTVNTWRLKAADGSGSFPGGLPHLNLSVQEFSADGSESMGVFKVLGRPKPIVVSDGVGGEVLNLVVSFKTQAEWVAFEALRAKAGICILQSDMTDWWYVHIGDGRRYDLPASVTRTQAPLRVVQITCIEVDSP